jgi:hypothetical protein
MVHQTKDTKQIRNNLFEFIKKAIVNDCFFYAKAFRLRVILVVQEIFIKLLTGLQPTVSVSLK